MFRVGQKVKVISEDYINTKGEGFITEIIGDNSYMVASDKTLPKHSSNPVTGGYHLLFWAEELDFIE